MGDPVFSPDGQFMWDGSQWIPAPPASQPQTTHDYGTNLHDSVMQATGDIIQGTSTRIDSVVIHQTASQPIQPTVQATPVSSSTEHCSNCLQTITSQNTRLKCQYLDQKHQPSCTETFCTSCELWWSQTARPPSIAPLCQIHFKASKEQRIQKNQKNRQGIRYNVIIREFAVPEKPKLNLYTKETFGIKVVIGLLTGLLGTLIAFASGETEEHLFVGLYCVVLVFVLHLAIVVMLNEEYKNYLRRVLWFKRLCRLEKRMRHQKVIQMLIDLQEYELLKVYRETYGLEG